MKLMHYYDKQTVLLLVVLVLGCGLIIGSSIASYDEPVQETEPRSKGTPNDTPLPEPAILQYADKGNGVGSGYSVHPDHVYTDPAGTTAVDNRVCYLTIGHVDHAPLIEDHNTLVIDLPFCQKIVEYILNGPSK